MCDCDLEMPEFITVTNPKCRKDHKCCECRGVIKTGEKYWNHSGKWDGEFSVYKRCEDCSALIEKIKKDEDGCACIAYELLYEEIDHSRKWLPEYVEIKRKRGANIPQWMLEGLKNE